jgi:hypothetical protein
MTAAATAAATARATAIAAAAHISNPSATQSPATLTTHQTKENNSYYSPF